MFLSVEIVLATDHDRAIADLQAQLSACQARVETLFTAIKDHNDECERMCGHGDKEGVTCGYRGHFPRRCPECPKRNWQLTDKYGVRIDVVLGADGGGK